MLFWAFRFHNFQEVCPRLPLYCYNLGHKAWKSSFYMNCGPVPHTCTSLFNVHRTLSFCQKLCRVSLSIVAFVVHNFSFVLIIRKVIWEGVQWQTMHGKLIALNFETFQLQSKPNDWQWQQNTRINKKGNFVILSLVERSWWWVINKVEEIRISCEWVGGSILEAIPNTSNTSNRTHTGIRLEQEQQKDHCEVIKEYSLILLGRLCLTLNRRKKMTAVIEELTKEFNRKMQFLKFSLGKMRKCSWNQESQSEHLQEVKKHSKRWKDK